MPVLASCHLPLGLHLSPQLFDYLIYLARPGGADGMPLGLQPAGGVYGYLAADISLAFLPGFTRLAELKEAEAFGGNQAGDTEAVVKLTEVYILGVLPRPYHRLAWMIFPWL